MTTPHVALPGILNIILIILSYCNKGVQHTRTEEIVRLKMKPDSNLNSEGQYLKVNTYTYLGTPEDMNIEGVKYD